MTKFDVKTRWGNKPPLSACPKLGVAVQWARLGGVTLREAQLTGAKIGFKTSDDVPARMISHSGRFRTNADWMAACHKVWISATYSPAYDVHWLTRARADQIMDAEAIRAPADPAR